ncbi:thiolase family protein [Salipiger abyssi]|uniref:thiolase family protein n=1 Tax=Salipiger abyssi TaxID=1250539 RepID=UPI001A90690A|nr:thiolase family protein [Salipiger abyssi]MBN9887284.1 thiolase family protein [Salipiger abyssi]
MRRSVIVAARRSAVVPRGGALADREIHELAAPVMRACLGDAGLPAEAVDEVLLGNALGAGGNPARLSALAAGLPERVAGISLDRQCCSGLDALLLADALIVSGQADMVLAGGAESYSRRPIRLRPGEDGAAPIAYDRPPFTPWPDRDPDMAEAAAALAQSLGYDRARQDAWAVSSHEKACAARDRLAREIVGLPDRDAFSRRLSPAVCARARTISGSVTSANMAVAADAAAMALVVSEDMARRAGLAGLAILGGVSRGGDPGLPGLAPVAAIRDALAGLSLAPAQLAQAEIMEAFAAQALACVDLAELDARIVNPRGGALARGHPIGASGAILSVRLFHDLCESGGRGLVAIAAAGGVGTALVTEWQHA